LFAAIRRLADSPRLDLASVVLILGRDLGPATLRSVARRDYEIDVQGDPLLSRIDLRTSVADDRALLAVTLAPHLTIPLHSVRSQFTDLGEPAVGSASPHPGHMGLYLEYSVPAGKLRLSFAEGGGPGARLEAFVVDTY
jgi:hypothetical protein